MISGFSTPTFVQSPCFLTIAGAIFIHIPIGVIHKMLHEKVQRFISDLQVFQHPFLSEEKKYRTFQLHGDSMLPIPEKAWVTGEYLQDWSTLKTGEACVVLTVNDGIVFKIAENKIGDEGKLVLYSLNPMYEPYQIPVGEIREIWRFVHFISHEIPEPILPENQLVRTVATLKQDLDRLKMKVN